MYGWHLVYFHTVNKDELLVSNKSQAPPSLTPSVSELKAVLQRSPIRFRGNRGDLPTCIEYPSSGEKAQRAVGKAGVHQSCS